MKRTGFLFAVFLIFLSAALMGCGDSTSEEDPSLVQIKLTDAPGPYEAVEVTVNGEVRGNVTAQKGLHLADGAKIIGDIRAGSITIEDGAMFKGRIEMEAPPRESFSSSALSSTAREPFGRR